MATFIETQFPTDISYGSKGGSGFNTSVFETVSGWEQRNINWSKSKGTWDVSYGIKNVDQMDDLIQFFMTMNGKAKGFRFKDWSDYTIINQQIATGDGSTLDFQIVKVYGVGGETFTRPIQKIVSGTLVTVMVNSSPVAPYDAGTHPEGWSVSTTTGILSFGAGHPPANAAPILISYVEFDVPARFDIDKLDISQDFWMTESWNGIPVVEIRV